MLGLTEFALLIAAAVGGAGTPHDSCGAARQAGARVAEQQVDLIELNHFLDNSGRHVFDQLVFYEWSTQRSAYRVIAWRMVKRPSQLPQRTWTPVGYRCVWQDEGVLRDIWAPAFRESWSQSDPERENRKLFSEARRPELAQPRAARQGPQRR